MNVGFVGLGNVSAFRSPPESGMGWCFGAIPVIQAQATHREVSIRPSRTTSSSYPPVRIWQVLSSSFCPNVPPYGVLPVEADGIRLLDLHDPVASPASDPLAMFGSRTLLVDGHSRRQKGLQ